MRKIATLLILCFMPICLFAQTYKMYQTRNYHNQLRLNTATGEVLQVQDDGQSWKICDAREECGKVDNRFCLYETQNMWTFIMLDSYTGRLWQVQYDTKSLDNLLCVSINEEVLESGDRSIFSIQPMTSMFQYYLISNKSGAMWQFQWTTEGPDYRWIKRVN